MGSFAAMKWFGLVIIAVAIFLAYSFGRPLPEEPIIAKAELTVESLFEAAGVKFTQQLEQESGEWRELFKNQGFMSLYREVYRIALDRQRYDFDRQLAAVATLLIISHEELEKGPLQSSGKRLFIHFCRLSLLDSFFAFELTNLDSKKGIFSSDNVLLELWQEYLRQIWLRVVRPEIVKNRATTPENRAFAGLLPEFVVDLEKIEKNSTQSGEKELEDL